MHSIRAVYDGINFTNVQAIPVEGNYEVIITFVRPIKGARLDEHEPKDIFDLAGLGLLADDYDYKKMREARCFGLD